MSAQAQLQRHFMDAFGLAEAAGKEAGVQDIDSYLKAFEINLAEMQAKGDSAAYGCGRRR